MTTLPAHQPNTPDHPGFRPKLRYRKEGKGSLYLWDAIIKPGQVIFVHPEDIPEKHVKDFVCLDPPQMQEWAKAENEVFASSESLYQVKETETPEDGFVVVNSQTGKKLNEKKLKKEEAEKLRDTLNT